jgi:ribose 5-phosphate isomerase B
MKIALSCDHRGTDLFQHVIDAIHDAGHDLCVVPSCTGEPCDYPDMAWSACRAIIEGAADRAILICGSGIGMSMSANKIPGIRAALVHDDITAEMSRRHNDSNVLCLSGDLLGWKLVDKIVHIWLQTEFEGGRHSRRINKLTLIEKGINPTCSVNRE